MEYITFSNGNKIAVAPHAADEIRGFFWLLPSNPLSPVKLADLQRIAQRLLDETGCLTAPMLHRRAAGRIPGSLRDYDRALLRLSQKRLLDMSKKRHYNLPKG